MPKKRPPRNKNNWGTPVSLFKVYDDIYHFTLDVCANKTNKKLDRYFDIKTNGLKQDWSREICWCNPPYGRGHIKQWVKKAYEESLKGAFVCMLLPVWTGDSWFRDYVEPYHSGLKFLPGKYKFEGAEYPAFFHNMIVTFGEIKQ